ncbi:MAG: hypothetical protein ABIR06_22875 [Cyclobacteriaceae bacterium]
MENEGRIVEGLSEMLLRQDDMLDELRGVKNEVIKLNLQTSENTRAILKLADRVEKIADPESRVSKLEKTVYK